MIVEWKSFVFESIIKTIIETIIKKTWDGSWLFKCLMIVVFVKC